MSVNIKLPDMRSKNKANSKKNAKPDSALKKRKYGDELGFASREAFNTIRTNLNFVLPNKSTGKIFGTTSANPQDGKSGTSINLAYTLAKGDKKVLLIDADMRRPALSKYLKLKGKLGLSNVLGNRAEMDVYKDVLTEGMDVLSAGDIPPNPSELLASEEMGELLKQCAEVYDYILVDLPPVLSVIDPVAVSAWLDGIVVVIRHGVSGKRDISKVVSRLQFAEVHILGFVYNAFRTGFAHYYKKHDKYADRYGYGAPKPKPAVASSEKKPDEAKNEATKTEKVNSDENK